MTCLGLVESYLDRAMAYNGVTNQLVTSDGQPVEEVPGVLRAKSEVEYPTETVAITEILPDFTQYQGKPIEYGRM